MDVQFTSCRSDALDKALLEPAIPEMLLDDILCRIPKTIGYRLIDSLIAENDKFPVLYGNVDQHPVGIPGVIHFQHMEYFPGTCHGFFRSSGLQVHTDFPRGTPFGLDNGLYDLAFLCG